MMNDEMRNNLIDEVTEWMADDAEFSTEFLRQHGESWLVPYSLKDLHEDYYGCELADTINAFINSDCSCSDWCDYFVDDNGDLHDWDDVGEVVSEMVWDDPKYAEWCVEELEEGLITEPKELVDIFNKYAATPWEDVASAIEIERNKAHRRQLERCWLGNDEVCLETFVSASREVVAIAETCDALRDTRFFGADEDEYSRIVEDFENDNLLNVLIADSQEYVSGMHVPYKKALEIIVRNEYLKGRWL